MKISLVIPSFFPAVIYGGPVFSTFHTCEELAKIEDVEVYVSTTNANMTTRLDVQTNEWTKFEENFFVKYYNETKINKYSLSLILGIWKDINHADVVHVQSVFSVSTPVSLFFAWFFKKPILLSPRGQFGMWCLDNGSVFKQKWLNWCIKPFTKNITWHATAEQEKDEIQTIFPNVAVEIVSNGIEYEKFQNSNVLLKKEYLKKFTNQDIKSDKIIVSMGRLQKKKGFDILIDSFNNTLKLYPNSILLIAGEDEGEEKNLKKQIGKLDLGKQVFLIGAIGGQDKIDFLANADLFVLPSHNENFGNVYVESLAAGTPIVASKNTPWSEVEEVDCGKWVNNTVGETAEAIIDMLKKDRDLMRENSKKFAKQYDWKNIAVQFKEVFEMMIK